MTLKTPKNNFDIRFKSPAKMLNPAFRRLMFDKHRVHVIVGGASSGKSYDEAVMIVLKMLTEPGHRFLVVRKVAKTLRHSCYDLIIEVLRRHKLLRLFSCTASTLTIKCKINGNLILMAGLDDVEKLKSIFGITDIWIEEASETTEHDFNQLDLRLRGPSRYKKQITLTLNPISALHWIKARFFDNTEPDCLTHRTTYKDNIFLDRDTCRRLEQITDPYYRSVYVLGEWGIYGNIVFSNFVIEEFDYTEDDLEDVSNGMDYGFVHASTLQRCGFRDGELYSFDEVWGKNWTNDDFITACSDYFGDDLRGMLITADSAEPDRIEEWERRGYTVEGAKKGSGSLRTGVDYLTSRRWHIHPTKCPRLAREVPVYQRREDKDGNVLEGKFVEINDDCIAATRYATEHIWGDWTGVVSEASADDLGL